MNHLTHVRAAAVATLAALLTATSASATVIPHPTGVPVPASYSLPGLGTLVVPGYSVGRLKIPSSISAAGVKRAFGRPSKAFTGALIYGKPAGQHVAFDFSTSSMTGGVPVGLLDEVAITSPAYRTSRGIGVGSTPAQVRRAYPGWHCSNGGCGIYPRHGGYHVDFAVLFLRGKVFEVDFGVDPSSAAL